MKKAVFLLLLLVASSFAATTAAPSLTISVSNITETIRPGASFTVQVKVQNDGQGTASNVTVVPTTDRPFAIKTGTSSEVSVGSVGLGQIGTANLHLQALPGTPSDVYNLEFVTIYWSNDNQFSITRSTPIRVEANPILEIIEAEYDKINPGDFAEISLKIKNIGSGEARNVRIVYTNVTSSILPAGSAVAHLSSLDPGKTKTVDIPISVSGDAEAGTYALNFEATYEDQAGVIQPLLARAIGVKVDSNIELKTFFESGRVIQGTPSEIVLSIANTGPNTAQYLEVIPVQKRGMSITPASIYVGNVESDDFDTAELTVTSENAGMQDIEITLLYKDHFNQAHEATEKVVVKVLTQKEAAALQPRSYGSYFLLLILIGGGVWYWRRRKKKKA